MRLGWMTATVLASCATFATVAVVAQDTETTGDSTGSALAFQARDWMGGDGGFAIEHFKGEVVLLEAWATT